LWPRSGSGVSLALTATDAMIRAMPEAAEEQALSAFRDAQELWRGVVSVEVV